MSQPGSPQAAGSGPEAMLASLLLQLQQGQAEIARTAQEGLKQLADGIAQSAKRPGIVDVKGIGKLDVLKGTHEEVKDLEDLVIQIRDVVQQSVGHRTSCIGLCEKERR